MAVKDASDTSCTTRPATEMNRIFLKQQQQQSLLYYDHGLLSEDEWEHFLLEKIDKLARRFMLLCRRCRGILLLAGYVFVQITELIHKRFDDGLGFPRCRLNDRHKV